MTKKKTASTTNPRGESSGTYNFHPAITQIITAAYRKIGAIEEDEQPTPGMFNDAVFSLNSIFKELAVTGIHVWAEEEAILFTQKGQTRYLLGKGSPEHCTDAFSYTLNTLTSTALTGATTVVTATAALILKGQKYGQVLDNGFTFWTTVAKASVGTTVFLTDPLPSQASSGQFAFAYTDDIIRPLKIPLMRRIAYQGLITTPLIVLSRQEFFDLPEITNPGLVTQGFYAPKIINANQGELFIWPAPQDSTCGLRFTWYRPLMDAGNSGNIADFPQEWNNTLVWLLAKEVAPEFGVPPEVWTLVTAMANEKLAMVQDWDRESEDIQFGLDLSETDR